MIDWANISLEDLAAYLSKELEKEGIEVVLVGGACVSIYSKNRYQSYDLDFVTYEEVKTLTHVMANIGFHKKGRYFIHDNCPWFIDFVAPPIAVGDEPIHNFYEKRLKLGTIRMLRPEDSVKDRLASYFHWNDTHSLEQAINICLEQKVNLQEVKKWASKENMDAKYKIFLDKLRIAKSQ